MGGIERKLSDHSQPGWSTFILSETDHRMSEANSWAADQIETLKTLLPKIPLRQGLHGRSASDAVRGLGDSERKHLVPPRPVAERCL